MAPEQFSGDVVDERVDVYALGVILFEMLAGRPPFDGTFSEVVGKHLYAEPPTFASLELTIPADVEAVVRRALAKKVADRTPSVYELARDFVKCFGIEVPSGTSLVVPAAMTSRTGLLFEGLEAFEQEASSEALTATPSRSPEQYATRIADRGEAETVIRPYAPGNARDEGVKASTPESTLVYASPSAPPTDTLAEVPAAAASGRSSRAIVFAVLGIVAVAVLLGGGVVVTAIAVFQANRPAPPAAAPPSAPATGTYAPPARGDSPDPASDSDEDASYEGLAGVPFYVDGRLVIYGPAADYPTGTALVLRDVRTGVQETFPLEPNDRGTKWIVKKSALSAPGGRTVEELVPPHTWVEIVVRRPDGTETSPRMITRADE